MAVLLTTGRTIQTYNSETMTWIWRVFNLVIFVILRFKNFDNFFSVKLWPDINAKMISILKGLCVTLSAGDPNKTLERNKVFSQIKVLKRRPTRGRVRARFERQTPRQSYMGRNGGIYSESKYNFIYLKKTLGIFLPYSIHLRDNLFLITTKSWWNNWKLWLNFYFLILLT